MCEQMSAKQAHPANVLVISERPILCHGLKHIIEKSLPAAVTTVDSCEAATKYINAFSPGLIVLARPNVSPGSIEALLQKDSDTVKLVVVGWEDDKIALYYRSRVRNATVQNLIEVIKENISNGSTERN